MNWDISVSKQDDLVIVKTSGIFSYQQVLQMTKETFNAATENGIKYILGDHRDLEPQISLLDSYKLPRDLLIAGVERPLKVAVVYTKDSTKSEEIEFFETTALNVGITVKSFTNINDARLWLRSGHL